MSSSSGSPPMESGMDQCQDDELMRLLSQIAGYVSIACWVVVGFPQILENYKLKSGESLSLVFLYVWLLGDMFNTIGVLFEQLPLPMLLINVWYAVMDGVLIGQVYYYRSRAKTLGMPYASVNSTYTTTDVMSSRDPMAAAAVPVDINDGDNNFVTPQTMSPLGSMDEKAPLLSGKSYSSQKRTFAISAGLLVASTTLLSMARSSAVAPVPLVDSLAGRHLLSVSAAADPETIALVGEVCAWISAALYTLSRVPQIYKNWRNRSCEGLSKWLFVFAVCGNLTFTAQVFLCETESDYLLKTLPFICGSLGTLVLDSFIFMQFLHYGALVENAKVHNVE